MKAYTATFETTFWRYNLIIAITIVAFLINAPFLALIVLPLFVTTLMGISINTNKKAKESFPSITVYPAEEAEKIRTKEKRLKVA